MFTAQKRCQFPDCTRAAAALCFCCSANVCTRHFTDHIEAIRAQIDPLANEVNIMVENMGCLTLEKLRETSLSKLRQWQIDMRRIVDEIFEEKSLEIENFCQTNEEKFQEFRTQQMSTMMTIQDEIKQMVEDGDATVEQIQLLKSQLQHLEKDVDAFEQGFLVINAAALAKGLVHVSSNIKKPMPNVAGSIIPQPQLVQGSPGQRMAQHLPLFGQQQPGAFRGFGVLPAAQPVNAGSAPLPVSNFGHARQAARQPRY